VQSIFYYLMICFVENFLMKHSWKLFDETFLKTIHVKNMPRATLYVNKRAILLALDRQEKVFKEKIFLNSKKVMHKTERIFS